MSLQVFRDGRPDREANKVNNELLKKLQKEDDHTQIFTDFLKTTGDGTYGFMGSVSDASRGAVAPKATLPNGITRAERVARVRERMARNLPPISLFYDELTETEILAEEDAEAYEEGWICPNCLQYQAVVSNECNWRVVGGTPADPKDRGCGYRRDII